MKLTPAMKSGMKPKMSENERAALQAFKNVQKRKQKYLTEAHKKNSEAALRQIAKWQESPSTLEEVLRRQRLREQQAKNMG